MLIGKNDKYSEVPNRRGNWNKRAGLEKMPKSAFSPFVFLIPIKYYHTIYLDFEGGFSRNGFSRIPYL